MWNKKRIRSKNVMLLILLMCSSIAGCGWNDNIRASVPDVIVSQTEGEDMVTVGSICCNTAVQELTLNNANPADLEEILPLLPNLTKLTLQGTIPEIQSLLALKSQYPELHLSCGVSLNGKTIETETKRLDLSETSVTAEELLEVLPLFCELQELKLTDTALSDEELMTIADRLPGVLTHCKLPIGGHYFMTDSKEIDLSNCTVTVEEIEQMLPYFPQLKKLDMSFCGIADEEMDALNRRHPDVSIVWTVSIGEVKTRTDSISFYPAKFNYYPTSDEMAKLRYCTELIAVDIGHTRATDCEFLWYTPKVKYLILADTGITDITPVGNLKELIYLELFSMNINDYSPLLNCTKLQDLNIGTTHADPEPLTQMTWLHNLQWHRADQDPEYRDAILKLPEQLPDTNVVLYPKKKARNIGGPWRYIPNYYVFRDIIGATYFNQDQISDYWGEVDGQRIMACESGKSFAAYTLAEIVRERIDNKEPIIGIKNVNSEKAEILYQTLLHSEP